MTLAGDLAAFSPPKSGRAVYPMELVVLSMLYQSKTNRNALMKFQENEIGVAKSPGPSPFFTRGVACITLTNIHVCYSCSSRCLPQVASTGKSCVCSCQDHAIATATLTTIHVTTYTLIIS